MFDLLLADTRVEGEVSCHVGRVHVHRAPALLGLVVQLLQFQVQLGYSRLGLGLDYLGLFETALTFFLVVILIVMAHNAH